MNKLENKIKSQLKGKKPKPKWQCETNNILYDIAVLSLWLISVFGFGMLVYIISQIEYNHMPKQFNLYWRSFLGLPWELIIILIALIILIYYLSKKLFFLYRLNPLIVFGLIILSIVCGYYASEYIGLNNKFAKFKMIQNIYKKQGKIFNPGRGINWIGTIDKKDHQINFIDSSGNIYKLNFENNKLSEKINKLDISGQIKIIGIREGDMIKTFHIKAIHNFRGIPFYMLPKNVLNK